MAGQVEWHGFGKDETLGGLLAAPVTFTKSSTGGTAPIYNCEWLYKFTIGDKDPTSVAPIGGKSGNGASGDLASDCLPAPSNYP